MSIHESQPRYIAILQERRDRERLKAEEFSDSEATGLIELKRRYNPWLEFFDEEKVFGRLAFMRWDLERSKRDHPLYPNKPPQLSSVTEVFSLNRQPKKA